MVINVIKPLSLVSNGGYGVSKVVIFQLLYILYFILTSSTFKGHHRKSIIHNKVAYIICGKKIVSNILLNPVITPLVFAVMKSEVPKPKC